MLPWGHLAVAYLLYSPYSRLRFGRPPLPRPMLGILAGVVFADLVDKPLGWGLGIVPSRSIGHSLLVAVPLLAVIYVLAYVYESVPSATAFAVSHLSHLLTDLRPRVFLGYPIRSGYLFWPVVSQPWFTYHEQVFTPPAVVVLFVTPFTFRPLFLLLELVLFGLAFRRWTLDGRPGLEYVRTRLQ